MAEQLCKTVGFAVSIQDGDDERQLELVVKFRHEDPRAKLLIAAAIEQLRRRLLQELAL